MITRIAAILFLSLSLLSCRSDKGEIPTDILNRPKFTSIMIDVQLAEGIKTQYAHSRNKDGQLNKELYEEIFERHDITEDEFRKTFSYYQSQPELMEGIFEQVLDSLSKLEAEIKKEYSNSHKSKRDSSRYAPAYKSALIKQMQLGDSLQSMEQLRPAATEAEGNQSKKDLK